MNTPPRDDVSAPQNSSSSPGFKYSAQVSLVLALIAVILTWVNTYVIPITTRNAAASGDFANIYTFAIVSIGIVVVLHVLALGLGIFAAKRRSSLLLAGGGIALSVTGLVGVALSLFLSFAFPQVVV